MFCCVATLVLVVLTETLCSATWRESIGVVDGGGGTLTPPPTQTFEQRSEKGKERMFPGMFMRKPDKAEALKQLKVHVAMFGAWVAVIRAAPYVLHYFSTDKDELKLDF
ncbi:hypothetical protein MLD38_023359 [Melastoma candidum]|uniref:Uncharacterized protein n=1 Tax=Melastoma candidum TaxID=119954 RepID=A0ACB9QLK5_9MYRT|nr:hypothetical protein MLD38_023359 [Melastoma candidum]